MILTNIYIFYYGYLLNKTSYSYDFTIICIFNKKKLKLLKAKVSVWTFINFNNL